MLIANGLKCTSCFYIDDDVLYDDNEGIPECPHCGGDRQIDWSHGNAPYGKGGGYGNFAPVDMGVLGVCETKEQFDQACATIKQRYPGHSIHIESESASEKAARVDMLRQRAADKANAASLDAGMNREISKTKARLQKSEPNHPILKKSAAQLSGSRK